MHTERLAQLREQMQARNLAWFAFLPSSSLIYFCDVDAHLSERPFVVFVSADGRVAAIVPALEAMKATAVGIPDSAIFAWTDEEGYHDAFSRAVQALGLRHSQIGVEALKMRLLERDLLHELSFAHFVHADGLVADLRLPKDSAELSATRQAVQVAETALLTILPQIRVGVTEKRIAAMLSQAMWDAGAHGLAFDPIVAAGPNGAIPHAVPTNRPIAEGDLLILDWGAKVDNYPSDLTRTYAIGRVHPLLAEIHNIVHQANQAGIAVCRPNITGEEIDQATRAIIEAAGYGAYFIHRTGHGLGMEGHEPPSLVRGNRQPLPVGALFTVEPGIYLPNLGGVRIEDNIVLSADGYLCLSTLPRELQQIG